MADTRIEKAASAAPCDVALVVLLAFAAVGTDLWGAVSVHGRGGRDRLVAGICHCPAQRNPMLLFTFHGALFRLSAKTPASAALFQLPPRIAAAVSPQDPTRSGSASLRGAGQLHPGSH